MIVNAVVEITDASLKVDVDTGIEIALSKCRYRHTEHTSKNRIDGFHIYD